MEKVCGYTFMTPKELIDFMFEKKIRELDFTLDEDMEAISEGGEPTAWYGIKLLNLFGPLAVLCNIAAGQKTIPGAFDLLVRHHSFPP